MFMIDDPTYYGDQPTSQQSRGSRWQTSGVAPVFNNQGFYSFYTFGIFVFDHFQEKYISIQEL